jgi:hypothetical protein
MNKGYVLMYSGLHNPEKDLSEEEYSKIKELVSQLNVPYDGEPLPQLGFTGYAADFAEDQFWVSGAFIGWVSVFQNGECKHYDDTVGLVSYLHLIMVPVLQKHIKDSHNFMKEIFKNEKMSRVSE